MNAFSFKLSKLSACTAVIDPDRVQLTPIESLCCVINSITVWFLLLQCAKV